MRITDVREMTNSYADSYRDLYFDSNFNAKSTEEEKLLRPLEEAFANRTVAKMQETGSFMRIYGGRAGTLQHIDMTV